MIKFKGMGVALVTPFKTDFSVDYDALERIVEYNIENGTNYLVVMGTTAESATLSESEKKAITQFILKKNNGRLPLVLGIGGNNTAAVVNELKTTNLDGIDAILSVSPYYNKPTQEGIFQHFKAVAAATTKPIIIYNVPGRTASNILPSTVVKIANEIPNVIAIKEAAGDIVQAMQLIKDTPKDFLIISGDDMIALPMILAGGSGVISVIGEGFPEVFSKMVQLGLEGKTQEAYKLHYKTMHAIELIFREGNPAGIKAVFEALNLSTSVVRLPLISASNKLKQDIQEVVSNFNA